MGNKGTTTSTYTPAAGIGQAGNQALSMSQTAAQQPFQQPAMPVAGFTPDQLAAFQGVRDTQGFAQPYFNIGADYLSKSAAPITGQQVGQYLNPYADYVMGNMNEVFGQQRRDTTGKLQALAGGPGASRIAVGQAELARQQALGAGQTMSGIYGQALSAAQQDAQRQANAGFGFSAMGPAAQTAALQAIQAQLGTGGMQQQLAQAQQMSPYQQELARLAYPFQTAQFLSGVTSQLGPSQGGTTVQQQPQPSIWSQLGGAALTGLGFMSGNPMMGMKGLGSMGGQTIGQRFRGGRVPAYQGGGMVGGKGSNASSFLPEGQTGNPFSWQIPSYSVMRGDKQGQPPQTPSVMAPPSPEITVPYRDVTPGVMQPQTQPTPAGATPLPTNIPSPTPQVMLPPASPSPYTPPSDANGVAGQPATIPPMTPDVSPWGDRKFAEGGDVEFEDPATASPYLPDAPVMSMDEYMPNDIPTFGATPFSMAPAGQIPGQMPPAVVPPPLPPVAPAAQPPASMLDPRGATPQRMIPPAPPQMDEEILPPDMRQAEGVNPFGMNPGTNTNEALIAAGLGMMAGTSPYAGVNIGRGGLEGLKNLQQQRALKQKERHDDLTIGQRAKQLLQQAEQFTRSQTERERHSRRVESLTAEGLELRNRTRSQLIPGMGIHPETGEEVPGAYIFDPTTKERTFEPGVRLTSKTNLRPDAVALQRYMEENPNATSEQIADFAKKLRVTPAAETKQRENLEARRDFTTQLDSALQLVDDSFKGKKTVTGLMGEGQRWKEWITSDRDPRASTFQTKIRLLQNQLPRLIAGTARLSKDERDKVEEIIRGLGRFTSAEQTRSALMEVRKIVNKELDPPKPGEKSPTSSPKKRAVTSKAEYDDLPSGTEFTGEDGKPYRKP